jgi:hypothetical protein
MDHADALRLTAPCGIDCFNCELFEDNITVELRDTMAKMRGMPPESVPCKGCRVQGNCTIYTEPCPTRACVSERGIHFCSQCDDFPCMRLLPSPGAAGRFPHNMKLFNLCRIQAVGVHRWAEEEAASIRKRYFTGVFKPGHGPIEA